MKSLDIVVIGAGIGGLQTALALAQDDHRVTLLESVKEFQEVSVIQSHAQHAGYDFHAPLTPGTLESQRRQSSLG